MNDVNDRRGAGTLADRLRALQIDSPRTLDRRLEALGYRGQERARRAACVLAYRHLRRNLRLHTGGLSPEERVRENILFLGPTGSGKTYLVELLFRDVLRLPTVLADATQFSETGYVGDDVNTLLSRLFEAADEDLAWASCGVLCLDEFDKLATARSDARFAGQQTTKDVSGFGVQRGLLHLLAASEVDFPPDFGFTSRTKPLPMPMAGISFIACGAFSGFKQTSERMRQGESLGFGRDVRSRDPDAIAEAIEEEQTEHTAAFARYGFIPELIGRFNRIVSFAPLDAATLRQILEANVLSGYVREFAREGLTLRIEPEVLDSIVAQALKRETGARGLRAALAPKLEEAAYAHFGAESGGTVTLRLDGGAIVSAIG